MTSLSAATIILEYVCPALGFITATVMFSAPLKDVQKALQNNYTLGDLNPIPWAVMLGNCTGWVTYGMLINNLWIYFANVPGLLLSIYLNFGAIKLLLVKELQIELQKKESDNDKSIIENNNNNNNNNNDNTQFSKFMFQERLALCMVILWLAIASILTFGTNIPQGTKELIVGCVVNANLVFFYGAPLSTIMTVCKTRNSASIHIWTMLTNTANGIFWTAYGIAVLDPFVYVPNGLGALLGFVQMILCVLFPRMEHHHHHQQQQKENNEDSQLTETAAKSDISATSKNEQPIEGLVIESSATMPV